LTTRRPLLATAAALILGAGIMIAAAAQSPSSADRAVTTAATPSASQSSPVLANPEAEATARAREARARATGAYNVHGTGRGLEMSFTSDQSPVSIPGVTTVLLPAPAARYDAADAYARTAVGPGHAFANIFDHGKWRLSTDAPASVKADIRAKYGDVVNVLDDDGPRAGAS
jgi:hypothetical protein